MGDYFQDENQVTNPYGGTPENPYGSVPEGNGSGGNGFGIAALVLGIISLVFFCSCFTVITAPLAIIFGIVQLVKSKTAGKGLAIAGLITGIISLIAFIAFWSLTLGNPALHDSILEQYKDYDFEDPESIEQFIEDYGNSMGQEFDEEEFILDEGGYKPL